MKHSNLRLAGQVAEKDFRAPGQLREATMDLKKLIVNLCDRYLERYPMPEEAPKRHRGPGTAKKQQIGGTWPACGPAYDDWRAYKVGDGPKVTAPRGKGKVWADRLYCEKRYKAALYYTGYDGRITSRERQFRAGSRNDRRRHTLKQAHSTAWAITLDTCEKVISGYHEDLGDEYWPAAKEMINDAWGMTQYYLYLARG